MRLFALRLASPCPQRASAFERYDWVWDGAWTSDLEDSILNLLVALDERFEAVANGSGGPERTWNLQGGSVLTLDPEPVIVIVVIFNILTRPPCAILYALAQA